MAESTYRTVPAVDKAARLLAALQAGEALGISELARRIGASKGTVRDILLTLHSHQLVRRDGAGRFHLDGADLVAVARPSLELLVRETSETALLATVDGEAIVIADVAQPATDLHMSARIGRRVPIRTGAHAKVLVGTEPVGFDDEEYLEGVRAAAAAVVDARGRKIAVLLVVGFKTRLPLAQLRRIGKLLAREAAVVSTRLQHGALVA